MRSQPGLRQFNEVDGQKFFDENPDIIPARREESCCRTGVTGGTCTRPAGHEGVHAQHHWFVLSENDPHMKTNPILNVWLRGA